MARIAGVDLPRGKQIVIALTYIYGVGKTTAQKVLKNAGVPENVRQDDLTPEQEDKIRAALDSVKVEGDLRRSKPEHQAIDGNRFISRHPSSSWLASSWAKHQKQCSHP